MQKWRSDLEKEALQKFFFRWFRGKEEATQEEPEEHEEQQQSQPMEQQPQTPPSPYERAKEAANKIIEKITTMGIKAAAEEVEREFRRLRYNEPDIYSGVVFHVLSNLRERQLYDEALYIITQTIPDRSRVLSEIIYLIGEAAKAGRSEFVKKVLTEYWEKFKLEGARTQHYLIRTILDAAEVDKRYLSTAIEMLRILSPKLDLDASYNSIVRQIIRLLIDSGYNEEQILKILAELKPRDVGSEDKWMAIVRRWYADEEVARRRKAEEEEETRRLWAGWEEEQMRKRNFYGDLKGFIRKRLLRKILESL